MPQAIVGFIIDFYIVGVTFLAGSIGYGAAAFVMQAGLALAATSLLGAISKKLIDIPDLNESQTSNLVTTKSTIEHQRLIYGETLVSGPLWYMNVAGNENQALYHCVVVAGHEIEDITDVWFDDNVIDNSNIDWSGDGSVDAGWPRGDTGLDTTTYLYKKLGTQTQTALSALTTAFTEINANHKGQGIAYFVARTDYFDGQTDVWSAGIPQAFRALVKGRKVYDPRSDSSQSFGTGPHRVNDYATWEWSDNPALCVADYMIDSKHGFGEVSSRIDYGYVASAAEWCDATVPLPDDPGPGGTDKRYRCNGVLNTGTTHRGNIESILSSANMSLVFAQGQWKLRPFSFETPTLQFTDDDLRGDIQIKLTTEESDRYNAVRGLFPDKDRKYQPHTFPTFVSTEYIARDNSETIYKDIQLPMTTDIFMAQRLAAGVLEQSDLQTTIIYPSNFKTLPVEIGGTVAITNTKMGWSEKPFRVTNYKLSDMKGIDLVLREDDSASYADVGTAEYSISSGGSYTTASPIVPAPTNFDSNNVQGAVRLGWTSPPARLYEYVQIYRNTVQSFSNATLIHRTKADEFIDRPINQGAYYYWIRSENFAGAVSSPNPALNGVNSGGLPGLFLVDAMLITDPSFELTKQNSVDENFWIGVNSRGSPGIWTSEAKVQSNGDGATGTPYLRQQAYISSEQELNHYIDNNKWSPALTGIPLHLHVTYRVASYNDISSAYIMVQIYGNTADRIGPGFSRNLVGSRMISVTGNNSVGWSTWSEELAWSEMNFSATNTPTFITFAADLRAWSPTTTGFVGFDIDNVTMKNVI